MADTEIFDLEELSTINKDQRKIFEYLYSKQDLTKYVQVNKKKYKDKRTGETKSFELKYLSWAYAYREMIRLDPAATYEEHTWPMMMKDGTIQESYQVPYMRTETGYFVRVSVTMFGRTTSEWLAVMDSKNNAINNPTATDINKALKRCYVKALALHGLGLFLYVGEDLPEDIQAPEYASTEQQKELSGIFEQLGEIRGDDPARLAALALKRLKIEKDAHPKKFNELTTKDYQNLLSFVKPQLMQAKKDMEVAKKAAAEQEEKEKAMAEQLAGLGFEAKGQPEETPTAQNTPQPTSTHDPNQTAGGKQQSNTAPANGQRSDGLDLVSKYSNTAAETKQGALFSNLGDILDHGPATN